MFTALGPPSHRALGAPSHASASGQMHVLPLSALCLQLFPTSSKTLTPSPLPSHQHSPSTSTSSPPFPLRYSSATPLLALRAPFLLSAPALPKSTLRRSPSSVVVNDKRSTTCCDEKEATEVPMPGFIAVLAVLRMDPFEKPAPLHRTATRFWKKSSRLCRPWSWSPSRALFAPPPPFATLDVSGLHFIYLEFLLSFSQIETLSSMDYFSDKSCREQKYDSPSPPAPNC